MAYAWDPNKCHSNLTLSNNNRTIYSTVAGTTYSVIADWSKSSGKWYWEIEIDASGGSLSYQSCGVCNQEATTDFTYSTRSGWQESWAGMFNSRLYHDGSYSVGGFSGMAVGNVLQFALDVDNGRLFLGKNGTWLNSADPVTGANPHYDDSTMILALSACMTPRYAGDQYTVCFETSQQTYTAPTGFTALDGAGIGLEPVIPDDTIGFSVELGVEFGDGIAWDLQKHNSDVVLSNAYRTVTSQAYDTDLTAISAWSKDSGKWYWEIKIELLNGSYSSYGVCDQDTGTNFDKDTRTGWNESWAFFDASSKYHDGVYGSYGDNVSTGDVLMFALDLDVGKVWVGRNGTWYNSGDPASGTNPMYEDADISGIISASVTLRYTGDSITSRFRESEQTYTIPTGFAALDGTPAARDPMTFYPDIDSESVAVGESVGGHRTVCNVGSMSGFSLAEGIRNTWGAIVANVGFDDVFGRLRTIHKGAQALLSFEGLGGGLKASVSDVASFVGFGLTVAVENVKSISPPAKGRIRFNEQTGAILTTAKAWTTVEGGTVGFSIVCGATKANVLTAGVLSEIGLSGASTRINDLFETGSEIGIGFNAITGKGVDKFAEAVATIGFAIAPPPDSGLQGLGYEKTVNPFHDGEGISFSDVAGALNYSAFLRANSGRIIYAYYAKITGAADGLEDYEFSGLKNFQTRLRSGQPSYLGLVLPYSLEILEAINARTNGDLVVEMAISAAGVDPIREELIRVTFDSIRRDRGGDSQSISVTGYKTFTFVGGSSDLDGVMTESQNADGTLRYRCAAPDFYLKPGHVASYGGVSFTVDQVSCYVGPNNQYMDVAE